MPRLDELTAIDRIYPGLTGTNGTSVLREIAERLAAQGIVSDAAKLHEKLLEREELCSTGVGRGVAIPHCKLNGIDNVLVAIGVALEPIPFGAVDGEPVQVFFVVVSPSRSPAAHLQSLAAISRWVKEHDPVRQLATLENPAEILQMIQSASPA
ncbi:MAG: PTS sugar transporter subunit IIA [Thermoanaerobaculia bacterium]|nr:PTS sugar transporter subunit IIA [Thermoanaerobaculia bacterium]